MADTVLRQKQLVGRGSKPSRPFNTPPLQFELYGEGGVDTIEIDEDLRWTWKFWKLFSEKFNRDAPKDQVPGERVVNWY